MRPLSPPLEPCSLPVAVCRSPSPEESQWRSYTLHLHNTCLVGMFSSPAAAPCDLLCLQHIMVNHELIIKEYYYTLQSARTTYKASLKHITSRTI